jgi:hypothetical protein
MITLHGCSSCAAACALPIAAIPSSSQANAWEWRRMRASSARGNAGSGAIHNIHDFPSNKNYSLS